MKKKLEKIIPKLRLKLSIHEIFMNMKKQRQYIHFPNVLSQNKINEKPN